MEFKFRAGDDRPPSSLSPSSSISFFSDQALRANYSKDPNFIRGQIEMYTIQREIEKEKIRLEIIAAENVRRRLLEEEVRRELMMEREAAVRGSSETGLSTEESHTTQLDSMFPLTHKLDNRLLMDRLTFPENHSLGFALDLLPSIRPQLSNAVTDENKSTLEIKKKEKLIILAKPDPNLCGVKRKAETPPVAPGELPFTNMKKKAKEEWSCALCEVSATSERGLNEHLQGRKHKAKEARLRAQAQKMRNNSNSSHSKESGKQTKVTVRGDAANSEQKTKVEEQLCQPKETKDASDRKSGELDLKNKDEKLLKNQENKNEKVPKKNQNAKNHKKKKLKFWCELCQVGAHSVVVMEGHKNGRKHLGRLKEQNVNVEATSTITTTTNMTVQASPKHTEKRKRADVVAKEANKKTRENDTSFEGANEKTGDGAVVSETNEKGTENDAVVREVNEETIENDPVAKEPSEKTIGDDAVVEGANKKTAEIAVMADEANGQKAEDDAMVEEANEKTAGNGGAMADEAMEKIAENDVVTEEAIAKTKEDEVAVAEEAN